MIEFKGGNNTGKFIEEFYYGNIDQQVQSTKKNKAVQKQMKRVA